MSELEYRKEIYAKAEQVKTVEDLTALLSEIENKNQDYGTIVYACMAAMKGAFNVVNRGKQGGITGFQAGCLGWECVHDFMMIKAPCRIVDYNNLLYPQYEGKFQKVISQETWNDIQEKARQNLSEWKDEAQVSPRVIEHWKKIKSGIVPFGFRVGEE